jgi:hypothetical protein
MSKKEERKRKKKALKTHRNFNYDITGIIRKILTRWIQQYQEWSLMITQMGHTCCQKQVGHPKSLGDKCDLLGSLLVTFFSVVEFILIIKIFFYDSGNAKNQKWPQMVWIWAHGEWRPWKRIASFLLQEFILIFHISG